MFGTYPRIFLSVNVDTGSTFSKTSRVKYPSFQLSITTGISIFNIINLSLSQNSKNLFHREVIIQWINYFSSVKKENYTFRLNKCKPICVQIMSTKYQY